MTRLLYNTFNRHYEAVKRIVEAGDHKVNETSLYPLILSITVESGFDPRNTYPTD